MLLAPEAQISVPTCAPAQLFDEDKLLVYRELYYDGFSSIIAARDLTSGAAVAVKKVEFRFFKPSPFPIRYLQRRYARKVREQVTLIRSLSHGSVLKLMEHVIEAKRVIIVTEMCMFGDLFNWMLQQPQLRVRDICLVIQYLNQALRYLHSQDYIHGALTPTHVLFQSMSPQSVTIMPDFGVRSEILFLTGYAPTIKDCYAPELLEIIQHMQAYRDREHKSISQFVEDSAEEHMLKKTKPMDIWSVGVIAHIAFTGKPPFTGRTTAELLENIKGCRGELTNMMLATLSPLVNNQLRRALCVDPTDRVSAEDGSEVYWFDDEQTKDDNRNILLTIEYELLNTCRRYRTQGRRVFEQVFHQHQKYTTSLTKNHTSE